jgi:hypothetical protein
MIRRYYWNTFLAGSASGVVLCLFQNPLDLWKVNKQTTYSCSKPLASSSLSIPPQQQPPSSLYSIRELSRGMSMTALRSIPGNGVFFLAYEATHEFLRTRPELQLKSNVASVISGAVTGFTFHTLFYPSDVIKSRMMTEKTSVIKTTRNVWNQLGIRGFYRGIMLTLTRTVCINSAGFFLLEYFQSKLGLD